MRIIRSLSLLVLFLLAVFNVEAEDEQKTAEKALPIKIGSILILTGEGSSWGNASRNGIDLAIKKINAAGGVLGRMLNAVHQDDQGDPKQAISSFRYLVEIQGIRLIIGPNWSALGIPLIDMAARNKVLMVSPSLGMARFNESSEFLFNTWPHDYILSANLAEYIYKKGHRKVALIGAEEVWVKEQTAAFKKRFTELGGEIPLLIEPLPKTTDLKTEALRIKNLKDIDAVVSTTDGVIVGSLAAKALKELSVKLPIYSVTVDQSAIDAAQGGFAGMEFLTFLTPSEEFKREYEAEFKTPIDIGADSAYDAVMMLAQAMRETGSTEASVLAAYLAKLRNYSGVSGNLLSDGKRGFTKQFGVRKVVDGMPQVLQP